MERIPEPELMLDVAQARAYAAADFEEPHSRFLELLRMRLADLPEEGRALDLGCGPGDITIRFARAFSGWSVDGVDGSLAMLELAREAAKQAGVEGRVRFASALIPAQPPPGTAYDLVLSNSLLHHLATPNALWSAAVCWARAGAFVFVMDLGRPGSEHEACELVDRYATGEPEVLRNDFYRSLLAAYRPEEIREQLARADLRAFVVETVSDRHWIAWGRLPAARHA